jgi:sugar porter (SP) family MFS transporter
MPTGKAIRVVCVALFSAVGSFLFGLDIGYIGPIIECDSFKRDIFGDAKAEIPSSVNGFIVSFFSLGAIFMAFPVISSYFLDYWGRRSSIMAGSIIFIVGSILQATSMGIKQLLVGRFVAGMSIGLLSNAVVLYQSELAPVSMRGALSTLFQLMITFGILIAAFVDQLFVVSDDGWRYIMWAMCGPALILLIGMFFLPRSPRWLAQQGRRDEALSALLTIRSEKQANDELVQITQELAASDKEGEPRWSDLFGGLVGRLVLLGVVMQLIQQLVGMNAFMYFGPKIFGSMGFDKNLFTTVNNSVNFIATFPAIVLADYAGRRSLMIASGVAMALACGVMGTLGLLYVHRDGDGYNLSSQAAGWGIAASVFFFVANFAYGFGPIVWVYTAEIFPMRYRARACGICVMANWIGNFAIAQFTPMLLDAIQFNTFYVFGIFCVLGVCLSIWLPETKNVELEDVGKLFEGKIGFSGVPVRTSLLGPQFSSFSPASLKSTPEVCAMP